MRYNINMAFIKKNFSKLVLIVYITLLPVAIFAQTPNGGGAVPAPCDKSGKICNPISANSIPDLIQTFLEGALKVGIPVVALAIVYSGFLFVFARGNSEKLSKAKDTLLWTLIGAAILLGSWAIAKLISATITGLG